MAPKTLGRIKFAKRLAKTLLLWVMLFSGIALVTRQARASFSGAPFLSIK